MLLNDVEVVQEPVARRTYVETTLGAAVELMALLAVSSTLIRATMATPAVMSSPLDRCVRPREFNADRWRTCQPIRAIRSRRVSVPPRTRSGCLSHRHRLSRKSPCCRFHTEMRNRCFQRSEGRSLQLPGVVACQSVIDLAPGPRECTCASNPTGASSRSTTSLRDLPAPPKRTSG